MCTIYFVLSIMSCLLRRRSERAMQERGNSLVFWMIGKDAFCEKIEDFIDKLLDSFAKNKICMIYLFDLK